MSFVSITCQPEKQKNDYQIQSLPTATPPAGTILTPERELTSEWITDGNGEGGGINIDLVEPDDVVVLQHLQDLNFAVEFAQIGRIQLAFVHDFDRHLYAHPKKKHEM